MQEQTGQSTAPPPSLGELTATFAKIGCLSFGGPAAQIALMHRIVVDEKRWVDEARYLHALNYCMLLPGPEAQQLATYVGWRLHGVKGGVISGLLFVLPGALFMLGLSFLYVLGSGIPLIEGLFYGIKAAVLALVIEALLRIARRAFKGRIFIGIAAASFLALLVLEAPFPLVVVSAGVLAYIVSSYAPRVFGVTPSLAASGPASTGRWRTAVSAALAWGAIWWAPIAIAALLLGGDHILVSIGLFFSKLAVITFGGAYALLAWLAQQAVEAKGWVTTPEMVEGLGLAETTPGPLILVTQFIGFLAAMRAPEPFTPLLAAALGAAMTTWVTFAPSFLWIFVGAPYIEDLTANKRLSAALSAITAAVVGTIAYLAVWFALHVLFAKVAEAHLGPLRYFTVSGLDVKMLGLTVIAFLLVFRLHAGIITTVAIMAALGVALRMTAV